jgi:adenosylcobinamide-GDP ribazoletransferase
MQKELSYFLNALRFLTIVPVPAPASDKVEPDWLTRSAKYFSTVGILVGAVAAGILLLGSGIWSGAIPAMLATAASVAVTGALHEDGLADTADGLGGGRTKEKRLEIMKDSRIGAYGVLALGFGMALRVAALAAMAPWVGAVALVAASAGGRLAAAAAMVTLDYAGDPAASRIAHSNDPPRAFEVETAVALVFVGLLPAVLTSALATLAGLLTGTILAVLLSRSALKLIGGYTGDVLGAIEQMFEIGFLLGMAAIAR